MDQVNQEIPVDFQKNIINIKKTFNRTGFFMYIFFEWANIRNFSYKIPIIIPHFFGFQINIDKNGWESIRKEASSALGYLKFILENGWMMLDKFEYNLLALSGKLIDEILVSTINYFHDAEYVISKLAKVEAFYLVCHYRIDYPERILSAAARVLKYFKKTDDRIEGVSYFIKRLLFQSSDPLTLNNLIVAMNMIYSRKYLDLRDLIQDFPGGVVSDCDFDCSEDVKLKIAAFIRENEMKLEQLLEENKGLAKAGLFLKQYSKQYSGKKQEGRGGILGDYGALVHFYDSDIGPNKPKFILDRDNLTMLAGNFIKRFIREFEFFLNGKILIEDSGEIQPFSYDFFMNEMGRMQGLLKSFSTSNLSSIRISHSRLSEIKKEYSHADVTHEESEAVRFISELSVLIMEIGKKTGHIFIAYQGEGGDNDRGAGPAFKNIDQSSLLKTQVDIPFGDKKIKRQGYLFDKSFIEGLSIVSSICFDAGRYLQNDEIISYRDNERRINDEIKNIRQLLERIADPVTFENIKRVYNI